MRKRSTELIMGSAAALCYGAFVTWMFCMGRINYAFTAMELHMGILLGFLLTTYYVNYFLCGRGVPLGLYTALQLVLAVLGGWLFWQAASLDPWRTGTVVTGCVLYGCGVIAMAYVAAGGIKARTQTLLFDGEVVMLLLLLLLDHYLDFPVLGQTLTACVAALAVTLLAMVADKVDREYSGGTVLGNPLAGRLFLAGLLLLVLGAAALLLFLASDGMHSVSEAGAAALRAAAGGFQWALLFLLDALSRLLRWLSAFFAPEEAGEPGLAVSNPDAPGGGPRGTLSELPSAAGWVLGALVLALIAVLLFRMRGERVKGKSVVRRVRRKKVRRQSGLSDALRGLLRAFLERLRYAADCLRYRRTAPGLLAWCERRVPKEQRRRKRESGEAFLLRLAARENGTEEQSRALRELAGQVERSFYSSQAQPLSPELYRAVRRIKFT